MNRFISANDAVCNTNAETLQILEKLGYENKERNNDGECKVCNKQAGFVTECGLFF